MGEAVSVVIPAYNAQSCLARAIESCLAQSLPPLEIIVVDDGSADGTVGVAQAFGSRIRLLRQPHAGAAAARNAGIAASKGDLIAFLDADDEWLEQKLARQVALHRDQDLVLSFTRSNEISPDGRDVGDTFGDWRPARGPKAWRALLAENFIASPTVVARRADLVAAGGFNEALPVGEDQDMWIRLALRGCVDFLDQSLVRVHVRADSLSSGPVLDQLRYTWPMIQEHLRRLAPQLGREEVRKIRARRLGRMGRAACGRREVGAAFPLLLRAVILGDGFLYNARTLLAAAPPGRWIRDGLRQGGPRI